MAGQLHAVRIIESYYQHEQNLNEKLKIVLETQTVTLTITQLSAQV